MKNIYAVLIFFLCTPHIGDAQPYQSFFANGDGETKWVFIWHNLSISVNDTAYVEKDTVVNGMTYKKIATAGQDYGGTDGWLMRENIDSGFVWFRSIKLSSPHYDDTTEQLVFRYDLNVGDTFDIGNSHLLKGSYPDSFNIVDSIRYFGGLKHIYFKGQYANYNEPLTIIEGVGSNMGILWKHMPPTTMRHPYLLCSYKNNAKTSYVNRYHNGACWIYSFVEPINELVFAINLYPQPANAFVKIYNKTSQKINRVQIISPLGRVVKEITGASINDLEIGELPAGCYYLQLFTSQGYLATKAMVKS